MVAEPEAPALNAPALARVLPWLLLALCTGSAWWLRTAEYPGWASVDEEAVIAQLQWMREGAGLDLRMGSGLWHDLLALFWCKAFGSSLTALHALSLLCLWAEAAMLYAWVRRQWPGPAAGWAVALLAAASITQVRVNSLLAFNLAPLQAILMLWGLSAYKGSAWAMALWGLLAGALLLDYEAWLPAQAMLALGLAWQRPRGRPLVAALLAWGLAVACVLWLSRDHLADWLRVRQDQSLPRAGAAWLLVWAGNLRGLFWGGMESLLYLGVPRQASFPWALGLGLIAAALLKKPRPDGPRAWMPWAMALVGLLPLALHGTGLEAQRSACAWPLLLALGAAGLATASTFKPRLLAPLLALALAASAWQAHQAYLRALQKDWGRFYAASANQLSAAQSLRGQGTPFEVLSELGPESGAPIRFLCSGLPKPGPGAAVAAWIPASMAPEQDPSWGRWQPFRSHVDEAPGWLLFANERTAQRLRAIDAERLAHFKRHRLESPSRQSSAVETALKSKDLDPWSRGLYLEQWWRQNSYLGRRDELALRNAAQGDLLPVDLKIRLARRLLAKDPAQSLAWTEKALRLDPQRREAWWLRLDALNALGEKREIQRWEAYLDDQPQGYSYLPAWLRIP